MANVQDIYEQYVAGRFQDISLDRVCEATILAGASVEFWRHPLGFMHGELTPVVSAPENERFRLHLWLNDAGSGDQLGDLHEHTWELTSLVLKGQVLDSNFEAVACSNGEFTGSRILYGDVNSSVEVGNFDLVRIAERTVQEGSVYKIPSRTIHLNRVSSLPTVTLVRSVDDGRGDGPLVLAPRLSGPGGATERREQVPASQVFSLLDEALRSS